MSLNPADYAIDSNYRHWEGDRAEDYIGPFFFRMDGENPRTAFRVQEHHCNAHNSLHGGVMMALADYTLCLCANGGESESVATVSCSNEFVAPAFKDDLVEGRGELVRRGGSIVFSRSTLYVGEKIVMTSSAVIKLLRKR